jgi:hypothetical protein
MAIEKIGSQTLVGGIPSNGTIADSTARPYSLANMDVDSALILHAIEKKLQIESTVDDIFVDIGTNVVFTGKKISVPDKCIMRIRAEKGAKTITMPILKAAQGAPRAGTAEPQQGYERGQVLKYMQCSYNEYSYALAGEEWGVNFNDVNKFGMYEQIQPQISKYFKEFTGKCYREALLETFSYPLTKTGAGKTAGFNPNIFVMNTEFGSQPAYSYTAATYRTNITTALEAAATGTNGVNANIDLSNLLALDHYAQNVKRIDPLYIGGKKTYFVILPSTQYAKLISATEGQLGGIWRDVSALTAEEQNYPGVVGRVRSLLIVEDQRNPEVLCTNSYGDNAMTAKYLNPGNEDDRVKSVYSATANPLWEIGYLLGAGAILDWEVNPLHFEMEKTEYGKIYGKGAFTERGIQLALYDTDHTDDAVTVETENFGSIALFMSAATVTQTA